MGNEEEGKKGKRQEPMGNEEEGKKGKRQEPMGYWERERSDENRSQVASSPRIPVANQGAQKVKGGKRQ